MVTTTKKPPAKPTTIPKKPQVTPKPKSTLGGKREGAGRFKGTKSLNTKNVIDSAASSGLLPHEWLLKVARGEPVLHRRWKITYHQKTGVELSREVVEETFYADFPVRVEAAKAAAPYYAPRLATQTVTVQGNVGLTKLSDDELKNEILNLVTANPELLALLKEPTTKGKAK